MTARITIIVDQDVFMATATVFSMCEETKTYPVELHVEAVQ